MRIGKRYIPPLALLMISLAGSAYAASILFMQTGPSLPVQGVAPQCKTLTPSQPGVVPGNMGSVLFDCSPIEFGTNAPAFIVAAITTMKPSYNFPTGYSGCTPNYPPIQNGIFQTNTICVISGAVDDQNGIGTTCNNFGPTAIAIPPSGPLVTLGVGSWYYCIEYSVSSLSNATPPGLGAFTVTWSTP